MYTIEQLSVEQSYENTALYQNTNLSFRQIVSTANSSINAIQSVIQLYGGAHDKLKIENRETDQPNGGLVRQYSP